jgi:chromosomal replication initiation ATPase DnaA
MSPLPIDIDMMLARLRRRIRTLETDDPQGALALRDFLRDELTRRHPKRPPNREPSKRQAVLWAAERACTATGVTRDEVLGKRRTLAVARARGLAMALCRARYGWSYSETGAAFGRDHTTVAHAVGVAVRGPWAKVVAAERRRGEMPRPRSDQRKAVGC